MAQDLGIGHLIFWPFVDNYGTFQLRAMLPSAHWLDAKALTLRHTCSNTEPGLEVILETIWCVKGGRGDEAEIQNWNRFRVENPNVQLPEGNGVDCRPMRLAVINGGHFHITRVSQNWQLALILGHFSGSEY